MLHSCLQFIRCLCVCVVFSWCLPSVFFLVWICYVVEFLPCDDKVICHSDRKVVCQMVNSCCQYGTNNWAKPVNLEEEYKKLDYCPTLWFKHNRFLDYTSHVSVLWFSSLTSSDKSGKGLTTSLLLVLTWAKVGLPKHLGTSTLQIHNRELTCTWQH